MFSVVYALRWNEKLPLAWAVAKQLRHETSNNGSLSHTVFSKRVGLCEWQIYTSNAVKKQNPNFVLIFVIFYCFYKINLKKKTNKERQSALDSAGQTMNDSYSHYLLWTLS